MSAFRTAVTLLALALPALIAYAESKEASSAKYRVGERLASEEARAASFRQIEWEDLTPKGWDPMAAFKGIDLARLQDSDPKAMEALDRMKSAWNQAPVNSSLDGQKVRIAGFVVPLERKGEQVVEFLLVPYFGACIHVPPPPANQIIHVIVDKPVEGMRTMDAMWVSGRLKVHRADTGMGVSGYQMRSELLAPYTRPKT